MSVILDDREDPEVFRENSLTAKDPAAITEERQDALFAAAPKGRLPARLKASARRGGHVFAYTENRSSE